MQGMIDRGLGETAGFVHGGNSLQKNEGHSEGGLHA